MPDVHPAVRAVLCAALAWREAPDDVTPKAIRECTRLTNELAAAIDALSPAQRKLIEKA